MHYNNQVNDPNKQIFCLLLLFTKYLILCYIIPFMKWMNIKQWFLRMLSICLLMGC